MASSVRVTSPALVGRGKELRSTFAALRNLRDGRPGFVTVSGPAGIGKTRFVGALAAELRSGGALVMAGACLDLGVGAPPYAALIAAFRRRNPMAAVMINTAPPGRLRRS